MIQNIKHVVVFLFALVISIHTLSASLLKYVAAEYEVSERYQRDSRLYLKFDFGRILDVAEVKQYKSAYDNQNFFLYQIDNKLYKLSFEGGSDLNCSRTEFVWQPGLSYVLAVIPLYSHM